MSKAFINRAQRRLNHHRSTRFQKCYPRKDEHCFELPLASQWHREQEKRGFLQLFLRYRQLFRGILWCLFAILISVPAPCYKIAEILLLKILALLLKIDPQTAEERWEGSKSGTQKWQSRCFGTPYTVFF